MTREPIRLLTKERVVTGLKPTGSGGYAFAVEPPWEKFQPIGLLIWGATEESFVTEIWCGDTHVIPGTGDPVCALFFSTGRSFEQIQIMAVATGVTVPTWVSFPPVKRGEAFVVQMQGPVRSLAVWGLMTKPID